MIKILDSYLEWDYEKTVERDNYVSLLGNYLIYKGLDKPFKRNCDDILSIVLRTALYAIEYEKVSEEFRNSNENCEKNVRNCFHRLFKREKSSESKKPKFVPRWNQADLDFKTYIYELTDYKAILKKITYFLDNYEDITYLIDKNKKEEKEYLHKITDLLKNNADEVIQIYNSLEIAYKGLDELLNSFKHRNHISEAIEKYMFSEDIKKANICFQIVSPAEYLHEIIQRKIADYMFEQQDYKRIRQED